MEGGGGVEEKVATWGTGNHTNSHFAAGSARKVHDDRRHMAAYEAVRSVSRRGGEVTTRVCSC